MSKVVSYEELKANSSKHSLWLLIDGQVYDTTKFLDEHPGGDEVLLAEAGKDATEAFEDVGHSDEARALHPDMLVGTFDPKMIDLVKPKPPPPTNPESNLMYFIPLALMGAYFAWKYYSGA